MVTEFCITKTVKDQRLLYEVAESTQCYRVVNLRHEGGGIQLEILMVLSNFKPENHHF